jgi:hypothetical protein
VFAKKKKETGFLLSLLLAELLQGQLPTWLQAQKHTGVHSPDANLKTHSDDQNPCTRKASVCGVASPGADLVLQSNLVCVYVLPRPKAGSKTSFGAARSFLPPELSSSELHSL